MDYRTLMDGTRVSTIGIGCSHLDQPDINAVQEMIDVALANGVNLIDFVMPVRIAQLFGKAMEGHRESIVMQVHLGPIFSEGQYRRSRDVAEIDANFSELLEAAGTDYAELGLIHYVDTQEDFQSVFDSGVWDYALRLRREGRIRQLGFTSHSVEICHKFLDTGEIDAFMFSVNPAYDFDIQENAIRPDNPEMSITEGRRELYQRCQREGIAITVMKAFGAGRLLAADTSPFGAAMTIPQCLQYALDRPGVVSCLLGIHNAEQLRESLLYYQSSTTERDYSFIGSLPVHQVQGQCFYCNHCLPCPQFIDIGAVGNFMDLALVGDDLAKEHYASLPKHASDCIGCGVCETNCPFIVKIRERMQEAIRVFGY